MPEAIVGLFLLLGAVWLFRQLPVSQQVQTAVSVVALIFVALLALWHFGGVG